MNIESKIKNSEAKIAVIGLGYVGLPLSIRFVEEGFNTTGFDIDEKKIQKLNEGKSYIHHIEIKTIKKSLKKNFSATNDFSLIRQMDVIIICVPTPLNQNNEPDLSYVFSTLELISPNLSANQLLILESTTYPGTTEEEIVPIIEKQFSIGKDYFIGYSPEREDPGNKSFSTKTIPKIVSGHTTTCLNLTKLLYSKIVDRVVPVSSTRVAEMTKILENIHRAVNIGLVNELKMVTEKMNINIFEVISAASTKPFGFTPFYPGPGLGGHCIPIDPFYLTWKAKKLGVNTEFIELAGKINTSMPDYVINKTSKLLEENGIKISESKILLLGISYKKNVDDTRESPAFVIFEKLYKLGVKVDYSDPYFPKMPSTRKYNFNKDSININGDTIKSYDLILICTDHDKFDYDLIQKNAKLIIDTRGRVSLNNNVQQA